MFYKASKDMLSNPNLSDSEKLLMVLIEGLSHKEGYCFATNDKLSEMLSWTTSKLTRTLSSLIKKNCIDRKFVDNNGRSMRKLSTILKNEYPTQKQTGGVLKTEQGGVLKSEQGGYSNLSTILDEVNRVEIIEEVNNVVGEFEVFWDLYKKKVDRSKCFAKWKRLNQTEKNNILLNVQDYVEANPEIQYRKNPLTYLNGRCWEDEIIQVKKETNGKSRFNESDAEKLQQWLNRDRAKH